MKRLCPHCGLVVENEAEWEKHKESPEHQDRMRRYQEQEGGDEDDPNVLGV